jgi:hypothetical protein
MRFVPRSIALALLAVACSSTDDAPTSNPAAEKACADYADVTAKAAQRCGSNYQAEYDAFIKSAANGSCTNIIKVRSEPDLRGRCFPFLQNISCNDLKAIVNDPDKLDASCKDQLVRK